MVDKQPQPSEGFHPQITINGFWKELDGLQNFKFYAEDSGQELGSDMQAW